jgi:hypothetical protein
VVEVHAGLVKEIRRKFPFREDRQTDLYVDLYERGM